MNTLRFTQTLLFLVIFNAVFAQNNPYFFSLSYPTSDALRCEGKEVRGQILHGSNLYGHAPAELVEEGNQFFLEIALKNSTDYKRIAAKSVAYTNGARATFQLPDSLKKAKAYLIRMVSTKPAITTNTQEIVLGINTLPYMVDFEQERRIASTSVFADLQLKLNLKDPTIPVLNYFYSHNYTAKYTNGENIKISASGMSRANYSQQIKDSISVFKISEIINECGVKGEIKGEAKVIKNEFADKIVVKRLDYLQCEGTKLRFEVIAKTLTNNSKLKIQFSESASFTNPRVFDITPDKDNIVTIDISSWAKTGQNYSYLIFSDNSSAGTYSNSFTYTPNVNNLVVTTQHPSKDFLQINFLQFDKNFYTNYGYQFSELIVNGIDLTKSHYLNANRLSIPKPKKDTTFTITSAVNQCGQLQISTKTISYKPKENVYITFTKTKDSFCENEDVIYRYDDGNTDAIKYVQFIAYLSVRAKYYNETTQKYDNGEFNRGYNFSIGVYDFDKKTVKFTPPANLKEQIKKDIGTNRKYMIDNSEIYVYITGFLPSPNPAFHQYNSVRTQFNFAPQIILTSPTVELQSPGFVDIPVRFYSGEKLNLKLSDGKNYQINSDFLCNNCNGTEVYSRDFTIRTYADKNTVFKVSSVENGCAAANIIGETAINVKQSTAPAILIEEDKLPSFLCRNEDSQIPFKLVGDWTNTPPKITGYYTVRSKTNDYSYTTSQIEVKSPFKIYNLNNFLYDVREIEVWFESNNGVKSQKIKIPLLSKPNYFSFNTSYSTVEYKDSVEVHTLYGSNNFVSMGTNGGDLEFKINGKVYKTTTSAGYDYQSYFDYLSLTKDSVFTINSVSNGCGVFDVNRKIRLTNANTVFAWLNDESYNSIYQVVPCGGSKRKAIVEYNGIKPVNDNLVIQMAKYNSEPINPHKLKFFDVKTELINGELIYTLPDSLSGMYVYRVHSKVLGIYSQFNRIVNNSIIAKPIVKLTAKNGASEITGRPGASLFLQSNVSQSQGFGMIFNNNDRYQSYEFGHYSGNNSNYGKIFTPTSTTTYSIKDVYNQCGYGKAEGNVKINVMAAVNPSGVSSDYHYCAGDSLTINLNYFGNFPKDTLMGVYLHNYYKSNYNAELTTFKNTPQSIKVKIPTDLTSNNYYIHIRKKSRKNANYQLFNPSLYTPKDSATIEQAKEQLDAESTFNLYISTPPNIILSGNTEIFAGQSATLNISPKNLQNQNSAISRDTVGAYYALPFYYTFADGTKLSATGSKTLLVKPTQTTTYTLSGANNACGVGKAEGSATVKVLNKTSKRIEMIGFPFSSIYANVVYEYYYYEKNFCNGQRDSMDVRVYGKMDDKYKVELSDKDGNNYSQLSISKFKIVATSDSTKDVRLWFQFPQNLPFGYNYRIKGSAEDATVLSIPLRNSVKIYELATASLSGRVGVLTGEKAEGTVKFTGDTPFMVNIKDGDGNLFYKGIPSKADSADKFKNFKAIQVFSNELKLTFNPSKAATYRVSEIANLTCGLGKASTEQFSIEIITSSEPTARLLVDIYPNPTTEGVYLNLFNQNERISVKVYSMNGSLLKEKDFELEDFNQKQKLELRELPIGTYLLKVNNSKLSQTFRIVKY
jgi:hypothetical protein